jgi:hypothetical protein
VAKLFEYAVILHPKAKKDASGNDTTEKDSLLVDLTTVLASSDREVSILAARQIPENMTDRLDEIEVVIRPF